MFLIHHKNCRADSASQNGTTHKVKTFSVKICNVAKAMEAIAIEGAEPAHNKRSSDYLKGMEYKQL